MKLHDYLDSGGATALELAVKVGVSPAQLRQWVHGYAGRIPGPANCVAIERATGGKVTRKDLRPDDWFLIWPELDGAEALISAAAPAHQAQAAIESVAVEVANA
jgi:DNA-binding transcriptional regulator YdaS (Cro superfamily)